MIPGKFSVRTFVIVIISLEKATLKKNLLKGKLSNIRIYKILFEQT